MLSDLYHAPCPDGKQACGTATIGSSEAFMLAGVVYIYYLFYYKLTHIVRLGNEVSLA
jgi:hypothetical protein